MGVCNLAGRIGAVLAPFITNLPPGIKINCVRFAFLGAKFKFRFLFALLGYELVPMALFALVSLLAGVSAMFISETRSVPKAFFLKLIFYFYNKTLGARSFLPRFKRRRRETTASSVKNFYEKKFEQIYFSDFLKVNTGFLFFEGEKHSSFFARN